MSMCSVRWRTGCAWQYLAPRVNYTENSFELSGFNLVGGYALQPRWADGHGSGIYSFTYLRRLEQASR